MRWLILIALLSLILGCAGTRSTQRPVAYSPGTAPPTFDLVVSLRSTGNYDVNGASHSFAELSALISRQRAKSVLVRNANSAGDLICVAMLGLETKSQVFFENQDGKPSAATWNGDGESTAHILRSCRE